jgi:hypothetical protein
MSVDTQHTPIYNLRGKEAGEVKGACPGSTKLVWGTRASEQLHSTLYSGSVEAQKVLNRARLNSALGAEVKLRPRLGGTTRHSTL